MKSATFIFSLDCEGKWGGADHLDDQGYANLTNAALANAYRRLVATFDRYQVPATFAFVSCLCLAPDQARARPDWFEPLTDREDDWFRAFRSDFSTGRYDGWLCPEALDSVRSHGGHEIASHGFSHIPLGNTDISEDGFRREMESVRAAEDLLGVHTETFVFPRNRVGHPRLLAEYGYHGYRDQLPGSRTHDPIAKAGRFLNEFNPLEPLQPHSDPADLVVLPAARMLLNRAGKRRWIPASVVRKKFAIMLDRAIAQDRGVNVFAHPHDFVTGWRQFEILDALLSVVAERARSGEIRAMTQRAYCEWIGGERRASAAA